MFLTNALEEMAFLLGKLQIRLNKDRVASEVFQRTSRLVFLMMEAVGFQGYHGAGERESDGRGTG